MFGCLINIYLFHALNKYAPYMRACKSGWGRKFEEYINFDDITMVLVR